MDNWGQDTWKGGTVQQWRDQGEIASVCDGLVNDS